MPRPAGGGIESGIEISRIRTKIVAREPSAITTRLSGIEGGSSKPSSLKIVSPSSTRPMKKTSLPSVPVCQAITELVGPARPLPAVGLLHGRRVEQLLLDLLALRQSHARESKGPYFLRGTRLTVAREPTGVATLDEALAMIAARAAELTEADLVVVRLADESGGLVAHAVHAVSESLRAGPEGSRIDFAPREECLELEDLPHSLRRAAERLSASGVLQLPVRDEAGVVGSPELVRRRGP